MLRPAVLWRKGSFGTHSALGSRFASRFTTTARSLRLQGREMIGLVLEAPAAQAGGRPPPSLVPAPAPATTGHGTIGRTLTSRAHDSAE